tara:strand:+ start:87 stop:986 length:900 start_codon:yes stop_codon:yes gene_type:complete
MLPIYANTATFDVNKYNFILKKKNEGTTTINVTTEDFVVIDTETGKPVDSKQFFPPNERNSYILITKLKSNPNNKGEEIHVEGKASINNGKKHARYQPTSCVTYNNKRDPEKVKKGLELYAKEQKGDEKKETIERQFELSKADRYFYTNQEGICNQYEMYIESIGIDSPEKILYDCLDVLSKKLHSFKTSITNIIENKSDEEHVSLEVSLQNMKAYTITITNESHTLGNLIQFHALNHFDRTKLPFIGYKNPHPLKDLIEIKLGTQNNTPEEINEIITITCDKIIATLEDFKTTVQKKL